MQAAVATSSPVSSTPYVILQAVVYRQQEEASVGGRTNYERHIREALGVPLGEGLAWLEVHDAMSALAQHWKQLPAGMSDYLLQKINERVGAQQLLSLAVILWLNTPFWLSSG